APGTTPHTKRKTTRLPRRTPALPPQRLGLLTVSWSAGRDTAGPRQRRDPAGPGRSANRDVAGADGAAVVHRRAALGGQAEVGLVRLAGLGVVDEGGVNGDGRAAVVRCLGHAAFRDDVGGQRPRAVGVEAVA